ncbi:tudor and KH domain-containing protein homolog [Osmia bicornis bicornis]|uniref:tudor and KH domain-containing protein homolog n=1 Tax=Osmia bicornis bicornis TaxID=1437191 RepID=UPI001EAF4D5B|nr:tudor and KH domain-containing protein homolog [Osmia bicornis bicornis]
MKWVPRYFTGPILLGLSLTSVSIAVIYVLYKKDEDDAQSRRNNVEVSRRVTIECKVPKQHVPAVIGRGGSMIQDVQNKTGTQIHFKKEDVECSERICIIRGSHEATQLAEKMIKSIIENQPIIEIYEMYVPQKACGRIIGKGGEVIQHIQISSGAKIIVESGYDPYNPNVERRIIIKGTSEQIAAALSQIEDKVREEKETRAKIEASSATRLPRGRLSPRNTTVSTAEQSQTPEPLSLQTTDGVMEVYVSAAKNPAQFWIQVVGPGTIALDELVSKMTVYYNDEENQQVHALQNVTFGQMVAAKFSFDKQWYRAEIISAPENGECEVYFVDYGDHEVVQLDSILQLRTDFLSLRLQAIECSLSNIKPRGNEWSSEACERFEELTWLAEWKMLIAEIKSYKERAVSYGKSRREGLPIPYVDLYDRNNKNINIGQQLINEGFAEPEEALLSAASSTLSLSNESHEITGISSPVSTSPLAKRTLSPETPANTSLKLDSTIEFTDSSIIDLQTPNEIDLTTPQRRHGVPIDEIDLVTPVKDETDRFIENERKLRREDGGGDYLRNGNSNQHDKSEVQLKIEKASRFAPAGYESDLSNDSDELELG